MIELEVPKFKFLHLENAVLDFNGTISLDGELLPEVADRLLALREYLELHVITADTFGRAGEQIGDLANLKILETDDHREEKRAFVAQLGAESVVAFGNGRNDAEMLRLAALGIAVCQREGAASETVHAADILCTDIRDGLDLLRFPKRLLATLRA